MKGGDRSGIVVGKQRVDPLLVATLITDPRFVRLVNAVKLGNIYWVHRLSSELYGEFGEPAVIAALEKVG